MCRDLRRVPRSKLGPNEPRLQRWTGDGSRRRTTRITFAVPFASGQYHCAGHIAARGISRGCGVRDEGRGTSRQKIYRIRRIDEVSASPARRTRGEGRIYFLRRSHNRLNLHPYRDGYRGKCPVHGGGGSTCTKGEGQKLVSPLSHMRL